MPTRKKTVFFILKLVFSLSIIAYLLTRKAPVSKIIQDLGGVDLFWLAVAFSLHAFGLFASAYRWQILARAQGDALSLGYLAKSYLVGTFFNNFLPSRFGGDIVRIWDGSRYSRSLVKSSAIVLVERLTGIIVLFIFALVMSLFRLDMARQIPVIRVSLLLGLLGLAAIAAFFLPLTGRLLLKLPEKGLAGKSKHKIIAFRDTIISYRAQKGPFLRATFWAFLLQLNVIVYYFLIGKALHLTIAFTDYFIFIPLVLLIQAIPISINGLGLRETSYMEIFKYYGIPAHAALAFSVVDVAFVLILGIAGGIIYITRK